MLRYFQRLMLLSVAVLTVNNAAAFSMLGVPDTWEIERIGHNLSFNADLGGVMNLGEEYRYNTRTLIYGFDESFRNYFGERGMQEVRKAIAMLNALPPVSKMSTNLGEFSTDTRRINPTASALGIFDLKSTTLSLLVEQLGLTSPERFTWCLHGRTPIAGDVFYSVIMRNFEPVPGSVSNYRPSKFVNGTLYTYAIFEFTAPVAWADAVEFPVDPAASIFTSVAGSVNGLFGGNLGSGEFLTGITRDDAAGFRYLYRPQNYNIEGLVFSNSISSGGIPWTPVGSGSNFVNQALRPGVDKITFIEGKYDSQFGSFIVTSNSFTDYYVTNNFLYKQNLRRAVVEPDIIFTAADLSGDALINPIGARTMTFINNDAINGQVVLAGPGIIALPVFITFNKVGPFLQNIDFADPNAIDQLTEDTGFPGFVWGSFDGTTNAPVIYPDGASLDDLERQVLRH